MAEKASTYRTTRISTCQIKRAKTILGPSPGGSTERSGCGVALQKGIKMDWKR
jgi:hypothetical protein